MTSAARVEARGLRKCFGVRHSRQPVVALKGVDLLVPAGALVALVGPDGAGKTTLMRMICGFLSPDGGTLSVLGVDAARNPAQVQAGIGYMPQRFGLYEDLTVLENLELYADLHGVPREDRKKRLPYLLNMTDLDKFGDRQAGRLSGGMKQKLGLACALVRSPELLLLDEPSVGVDPLSRQELWTVLLDLVRSERLSVLVSTAYMDEAERCDFVYVLDEGEVLAHGSPEELRACASGCCYRCSPEPGLPARILQAGLIDNSDLITDAVPEGGGVRFILHCPDNRTDEGTNDESEKKIFSEAKAREEAARCGGRETTPVPARLEDGFMVILRKRRDAEQKLPLEQPLSTLSGSESTLKDVPDREAVIEVRDLVRRFGNFVAVNNTSFSVGRGELFGLLGPNGAGKTTTFRMLCGLLPASGGMLRVAGVDLRKARAQAREHLGYVAQKFSLYGSLDVRQNLEFFGGVYGLRGKALHDRIAELLREFGLEGREHEASGSLPGGYKQRLSMACALLHRPGILFLDEPTSGIDVPARRSFWRRITGLAAQGTTVIITTHFMEEAEYCDRILIQDAGRVLELGSPAEVRARAGNAQNMEEAFIRIVRQAREEGAS